MSNGHNGDAYQPTYITLNEIADIYGVYVERLRSVRKHIMAHPEPAIRIGRKDYFYRHLIDKYIKNGDPVVDLRRVEATRRASCRASCKEGYKRKSTNRSAVNPKRESTIQLNAARAW